MVYDLMDTGCVEDGEPSNGAVGIRAERFSPASPLPHPLCWEMSLPVLAAQCLRELDNYRRGEPCTDAYGLELLHRATFQDNQEAWAWVQHCFGGMVRGWLRCHPQREVACRLESAENYVAQTFERFWQATAYNQHVEFSTLAAAMQYLRACLYGAILDMLRAYARPREISLPDPGELGEPRVEDNTENSEVWESLHMILSNLREQRLAFLLFHCGLKPREIIRFCPQEWSDVQEIYRLRRNIMERLLRNEDHLRWRLSERG
jgi:DNA-directed RNA polymerase specialized sigma24 family protein